MNKQDILSMTEETKNLVTKTVTPKTPFAGDDNEVTCRVGKERYVMTPQAWETAGKLARIPSDYLRKCPTDLAVPQLNYWFSRIAKVKIVIKEDAIQAFLPPEVVPLDIEKVLAITERVMRQVEYDRFYPLEDKFQLYAVGPKERAVQIGDVVRGGVYVEGSPLGLPTPVVKGYVLRLECTNGMVNATDVAKFSYGGDGDGGTDVWNWLKASIKLAYGSLSIQVQRLKQLQRIRVHGATSRVLNNIFTEHRLSQSLRQRLTDRMLDESPQNMYDVLNIITQVASHEFETHPDIVHRLMTVGGAIAEHTEYCPACHRSLN